MEPLTLAGRLHIEEWAWREDDAAFFALLDFSLESLRHDIIEERARNMEK